MYHIFYWSFFTVPLLCMDVLAHTGGGRRHLTGVVFHPPCTGGAQVIGFGGKGLYLLSRLAAHSTASFKHTNAT